MARSITTFQKGHTAWNKGLQGDPRMVGRKPWNFRLTAETSSKVRMLVERGAAKRKGIKQDPQSVAKRAETIRKVFEERPELREVSRQNMLRLVHSPQHHSGHEVGQYRTSSGTRRKISATLKEIYKEHPEIKEVACKALERGRKTMGLGKSPTEPERKVGSLLGNLNILAQPQYPFKGFFLDYALPDKKLAILVDGCFWHCCPLHFPLATSRIQQHNLLVDKKREKFLKRRGWRVLHIWEHEVEDLNILARLKKEVMYAP